MQQIFLTGPMAMETALKAFLSFSLQPAGFILKPLRVEKQLRGEVLHLLTPPPAGLHNDLPCLVDLGAPAWTLLPQPFSHLAAPAIHTASQAGIPLLLGGVYGAALAEPAFRQAVECALRSPAPVVTVVRDEEAAAQLIALTEASEQLWLEATEDTAATVLQALQREMALRAGAMQAIVVRQ